MVSVFPHNRASDILVVAFCVAVFALIGGAFVYSEVRHLPARGRYRLGVFVAYAMLALLLLYPILAWLLTTQK